jgi:hypothetical protein
VASWVGFIQQATSTQQLSKALTLTVPNYQRYTRATGSHVLILTAPRSARARSTTRPRNTRIRQARSTQAGDIFLLISGPGGRKKKARDSPPPALSTSLFVIPFPAAGSRARARLPAKTIIVKRAYRKSGSIRFRALSRQQLNAKIKAPKFSPSPCSLSLDSAPKDPKDKSYGQKELIPCPNAAAAGVLCS